MTRVRAQMVAVLASLAWLTMLSTGLPASAEAPASSIAIAGAVKTPLLLTRADLERLPTQEVAISFMTGHGQETGTFKGVLLLTLLDRAVVQDGTDKDSHLRHIVVITGRDGYTVALSMGELDPKFEGKSVLIAFDKDGQPLSSADGLRLVVPSDHHGGRDVRDVVRVEVQ